MSSTCLLGKVNLASNPLSCKISMICGFGLDYFPIYVDEGILLVDFKGNITKLFVKR